MKATYEIEWLKNNAKTTLDKTDSYDGEKIRTVSRFFDGKLPAGMVRKLWNFGKSSMDSNNNSFYTGDDNFSMSLVFGETKQTSNRVKFSYSEYTRL